MLYGAFVKAGDTMQVEEKKDYSSKVTDQELFEACEGRTARKGARGEQNGKLHRAGQLLGQSLDDIPVVVEKKLKPVSDEELALIKKAKKAKKTKKENDRQIDKKAKKSKKSEDKALSLLSVGKKEKKLKKSKKAKVSKK
jgi:hypothetical protein